MGEDDQFEESCRPKGRCYELAAKYVLDNLSTTLVHGRPTLQRPPYKEYGHAWVEEGSQVYDSSADVRMDRKAYYALGQIDSQKVRRYSIDEVSEKLSTFGHWGPWEGPDVVDPIDKHSHKESVMNLTKAEKAVLKFYLEEGKYRKNDLRKKVEKDPDATWDAVESLQEKGLLNYAQGPFGDPPAMRRTKYKKDLRKIIKNSNIGDRTAPLKDQLIKLGEKNPELRDDIRPVLDRISSRNKEGVPRKMEKRVVKLLTKKTLTWMDKYGKDLDEAADYAYDSLMEDLQKNKREFLEQVKNKMKGGNPV